MIDEFRVSSETQRRAIQHRTCDCKHLLEILRGGFLLIIPGLLDEG
jgi:hypothetical protein